MITNLTITNGGTETLRFGDYVILKSSEILYAYDSSYNDASTDLQWNKSTFYDNVYNHILQNFVLNNYEELTFTYSDSLVTDESCTYQEFLEYSKQVLTYIGSNVEISDITSNISIVDGDIVNSSFTKLGSDAPAIKQKLITGTMPDVTSTGTYATGLTVAKIIDFSVVVTNSTSDIHKENSTLADVTNEFNSYIASDGNLTIVVPTTSTSINLQTFTCLITYIE